MEVFRRYQDSVVGTGRLVGEQVRARLERAVMKWLGVEHTTAILAAPFASDKHRLIKYAPKPDPACWRD